MNALEYYWQKYPAKIQSFFCGAGDIICIASGAVGGNIFRALAPLVGFGAHAINVVFGKGGKTKEERFVLDQRPPSAFTRALKPWRYPVDTQAALIVLSGALFLSSGLNFFNVQGFINFPEAIAGCFCMLAASAQWFIKEKEGHLQDVDLSEFFRIFRRGSLYPALSCIRERMGPTRVASALFLGANTLGVFAGLYAMWRHESMMQSKDVLMVAANLLYLYGNYNLGRVKKARTELIS